VIYQHPLAYLLGLEGVALLRAFDGEYGREFTEARLAEPPATPVRHPADIWTLQRWCPAATNASYRDTPVAIIWHFNKPHDHR
jgi:hypothetical protein